MTEGDAFEVVVETGATGGTVVHVTGEVDLATTPQLQAALASRSEGSGLVIDLTECTFVDSSCVRLLASVTRETEAAGGRTAVVATDLGVLRMLEITSLDTLLPVYPSVEDALAFVAE